MGRADQVDDLQGLLGPADGIVNPGELRRQLDEGSAGEALVDGLVLGYQRDLPIHRRVGPRVDAENGDTSLRRLLKPAHDAHESRLPCPVWPEQTGYARAKSDGDLADRDFGAEPLGQRADRDRVAQASLL